MLGTSNRDRQAERREATRLEILDAAWEIARDQGLANLTLRTVAARVGMRAPSLYSYFASKNDIYDAMFGQSWSDYLAIVEEHEPELPESPRAALKSMTHLFFDFAVADLARHQLMNQRTIPGFEPSPEAYAPAIAVLQRGRALFSVRCGGDQDKFDIYTALVGGLVDAQQANDPGGDRWARLIDEAVDMFADHLGLPPTPRRTP